MNKKDKNTMVVLIIAGLILIGITAFSLVVTNSNNSSEDLPSLETLNQYLENITSMDQKLIEEVEIYGFVHPKEDGAGDLRAAMKYENEASFELGIVVINASIVAYGKYDESLMNYVDETNETYKEITDLRLEYRFGNITTEEFKNKINEYYYNGNPLLKKLITPLD